MRGFHCLCIGERNSGRDKRCRHETVPAPPPFKQSNLRLFGGPQGSPRGGPGVILIIFPWAPPGSPGAPLGPLGPPGSPRAPKKFPKRFPYSRASAVKPPDPDKMYKGVRGVRSTPRQGNSGSRGMAVDDRVGVVFKNNFGQGEFMLFYLAGRNYGVKN